MSVSSIASTPVHQHVKPATPPAANEQSKFKAGLSHQATEAQKSAVDVAHPAGASVHIKV